MIKYQKYGNGNKMVEAYIFWVRMFWIKLYAEFYYFATTLRDDIGLTIEFF